MIESHDIPSADVRPFLDQERAIPKQPDLVRARAMTRARAAIVARGSAPLARSCATLWGRWAAATTLASLTCAIVGIAAYGFHSKIARSASAPRSDSSLVGSGKGPPSPVRAQVGETAPLLTPIPPLHPSAADAFRTELHSLILARDALSRGNFSDALLWIGDHTRRFKDSRLAEEREVLKIKALVGLCRGEQARRAAAAFRTRFPHRVLLPEMRRLSTGECL